MTTATQTYVVERDPRRDRDFEYLEPMIPPLQDLANDMSRNIGLINPHGIGIDVSTAKTWVEGSWDSGYSSDWLYLVFWASPSESDASTSPIPSLFGREDLNPSNISSPFIASGEGTAVPLYDDNGIFFGEIVENFVYISFDLPHMETAGDLLRLMTPYIKRTFDHANDPEFLAELRKTRFKLMQDAYVEACTARIKVRSISVERSIQDQNSAVNEYQANLAQALSRLAQLQIEYKAAKYAERTGRGDKTKFKSEFEALSGNAKVSDIKVDTNQNTLTITTIPLISQWLSDGTKRLLGTFRVTIPLEANGSHIMIENLTNLGEQNGYVHPHIQGSICWGNLATGVGMLQGEMEFAALTELIIKFLEEPNPQDAWGSSIWNNWTQIADKKEGAVPRFTPYDDDEEAMCQYCEESNEDCICCWTCRDNDTSICDGYADQCVTECDGSHNEDEDCPDLCPCA